jgi:hypothetical protein
MVAVGDTGRFVLGAVLGFARPGATVWVARLVGAFRV